MNSHGRPRKVLITGISGFTGKYVAEALYKDGWDIAGLGAPNLAFAIECLDVDLLDTKAISEWIKQIRPTHVVHLAALSHVTNSNPLAYFKVNVLGTESLLQALLDANSKPEKIIIASSANVYGNSEHSPIAEGSPLNPISHYALSKVNMEYLIAQWFKTFPIIVTRPFNYTGPGQSEAFVFAKIIGSFRRRDPILRLGNLDVERDLSDIRFVTEVYRRLLTSTNSCEIYNICSGKCVSLLSIIKSLSELTGFLPEVQVDTDLVRDNEIKSLYGDARKLLHSIGHITIPSLKETLEFMLQPTLTNQQ